MPEKHFFCRWSEMKNLCIIGSGIKSIAHFSVEACKFIENSDIVLYLVNEPLCAQYIEKISKKSFDLTSVYYSFGKREDSYNAISELILDYTEIYQNVCVVFYGHPLFCVASAQKSINEARVKNINVISCPAISTFDCLISDLNIDPTENGIRMALNFGHTLGHAIESYFLENENKKTLHFCKVLCSLNKWNVAAVFFV